MGTNIRAEISAKSPYWLPKHRYYELKHFCMQYSEWKRLYISADGWEDNVQHAFDPTGETAVRRAYYGERLKMVEEAVQEATQDICGLDRTLLKAVTEGLSYEVLRARDGVPCCRDTWYILYRRFFWLLDRARK